MRHHSRRGFEAAKRRKLVWATSSTFLSAVPAAPGVLTDLLASYRAAGGVTQGCTVMRTCIDIVVTAATPALDDSVFVGLIVADANAANAQYGPAEGFIDWALYRRLYVAKYGAGYAGYTIDLRSKRKIEELQQTWYINLAASATGHVTGVDFTARTLLALP